MPQFSEQKFRITRRSAPLKSMRAIDYVTKVYVNTKQFLQSSSKQKKYFNVTEDVKRNVFSSERRYSIKKKYSDDGCDEETSSNSKLRDTQIGKESLQSSGGYSKRTSRRYSPKQDDTTQSKLKSQITSQLVTSQTQHESSDSLIIKNYITNIEESKQNIEKRNSLPNTPTQSRKSNSIKLPKQKFKQEQNENERINKNNDENQILSHESQIEDKKSQSMSGRNFLLLQRQQLQKLDQFINKRDDIELDNFIKEEEEDDDDLLFNDQQIKKNKTKSSENELDRFIDSGQELSIIQKRILEPTKQPLNLQNLFKYQRNSFPFSKTNQRNNSIKINDIESILNELDQEDAKQRVIHTQNFTFNSFKKNIGLKKNTSLTQSTANFKIIKNSINPLTEANKILQADLIQNTYNQQKQQFQQKMISSTQSNNFFSQNTKYNSKSSHMKQRQQTTDVNYLMNQNFLQDIRELKKQLSKQTQNLKALNI